MNYRIFQLPILAMLHHPPIQCIEGFFVPSSLLSPSFWSFKQRDGRMVEIVTLNGIYRYWLTLSTYIDHRVWSDFIPSFIHSINYICFRKCQTIFRISIIRWHLMCTHCNILRTECFARGGTFLFTSRETQREMERWCVRVKRQCKDTGAKCNFA